MESEKDLEGIGALRMKQMIAKMKEKEYAGLSDKEIKEKKQQEEMKKKINIDILNDTFKILEMGKYVKDGKETELHCSVKEMKKAKTFLPENIFLLRNSSKKDENQCNAVTDGKCSFKCENEDTLFFAQKKYMDLKKQGLVSPKIFALNMASATEPGGRTRKGANAQEEEICRRTSLLMSLEGEGARKYYEYNNQKKTHMGSDAIIISECVEVIKDSSYETLKEPFIISVLSSAAPMVRFGFEGMSEDEYKAMLRKRIEDMFLVAASLNYRHLIMGAFGCGIFGNDAALVSDTFKSVIENFKYKGLGYNQLFDSIDFAVLCSHDKDYNYKEFCRNFG